MADAPVLEASAGPIRDGLADASSVGVSVRADGTTTTGTPTLPTRRFVKGEPTPGRLQLAADAARLAASGMKQQEIAERLSCSRSYVGALLNDPTGEKERARKDTYRGTCEECGKPTAGCKGRANAPKICATCHIEAIRAPHGTRKRYWNGCSCDECLRANREYQRTLKGQEPPNHGTVSGYTNYACRCDACREAARVYQWMHPEYQRRYRAKKKAEAA